MSAALFFILEVIGTAAFSISGVLTAAKRKMDLFGVLVLAITTATGGGILRDLVLGITPPGAFTNPLYVEIALVTALIFMIFMKLWEHAGHTFHLHTFNVWMNLIDAAGLGAFCVVGVNTALDAGYAGQLWLLVFVGTITGVGGGMLRDIFCGQAPVIFRRRVYAVAAILGSLVYAGCMQILPQEAAMLSGTAVVIVIRMLATALHWDLPVFTVEATDPAEGDE